MKKRRTLIVSLLLVAAMVVGIGYAALTSTLTINGTASLNNSVGGGDEGGVTDTTQMKVYFTNAKVDSTNIMVPGADGTLTGANVTDDLGTVAVGGASNNGAGGDGGVTASGTAISASYNALGLKQAGDTVTFEFTVTNQSTDTAAYLRAINIANGKVYSVADNGTKTELTGQFAQYFAVTVNVGSKAGTFNEANPVEVSENDGTLKVYVTLTLNKTLGADDTPAVIAMDSSVITLTFKDTATGS